MLLIAALNDLDVQGGDIQNAYLTAPNREKHWMKAGPEFGELEGKHFIVSKALYGLKSAGASFRSFLAKKIDSLGFTSCLADPDLYRDSPSHYLASVWSVQENSGGFSIVNEQLNYLQMPCTSL